MGRVGIMKSAEIKAMFLQFEQAASDNKDKEQSNAAID
jgi:hypothetical protein